MIPEVAPTLGAAMGLGFVLGLKHATEADHVVAVSAIVTEHGRIWKSALVGAFWGIGHTLALLVAGLVLLNVRTRIPEGLATWLEMLVAAMIVWLGVGVLRRLLRDRTIHAHAHEHDGTRHIHFHVHAKGREHVHDHGHGLREPAAAPPASASGHRHVHRRRLPPWGIKAIAVGVVHGLAGSGALTLLVMQQLPSVVSGLAYIAVFGIGTVAGMLIMSGLVSVPLTLAAGRYGRVHGALCGLAGVGSVVFGLYYGYSVWAKA